MIISICGKSGSGKSTLAQNLKKEINNSFLIDIDKIAHNIYNQASQQNFGCNNLGRFSHLPTI